LPYSELFADLESAEEQLGRKINPTVYSPAEFAKRISEGNSFVRRVMERPIVWLFGEES
jgi:hypothetical protein